jgi:tRNA pseudouridine38-40 synthase
MIINTTRTIYRIELVKESSLWSHGLSNPTTAENHNNYRIDFYIQGALYKMIRNIVGAAVEASRVITADQEKNNKRRQVDENDIRRLLQRTIIDGEQEQKSNTTTISNEPRLTRKDNLSKPAPPEGLTLEWVFYDDDDDNNYEYLGCRWRDVESSIILR